MEEQGSGNCFKAKLRKEGRTELGKGRKNKRDERQ
jgi:hypothetical protein